MVTRRSSAALQHRVFAADVGALGPRHVLREGQAARVFRFHELPPLEPVVAALLERYHDTCAVAG